MFGRRDAIVGAGKFIAALDAMAYDMNGYTTITNIQSRPFGLCNIQSKTKVVFCLNHKQAKGLDDMGSAVLDKIKAIANLHGLEYELEPLMCLYPGDFTPEAVDCVRRACGEKGIPSRTGTGHDSLNTVLKCPTGMVFVRAKNGISHCAKEWSDKEDCSQGALALGKAVLNYDDLLSKKS